MVMLQIAVTTTTMFPAILIRSPTFRERTNIHLSSFAPVQAHGGGQDQKLCSLLASHAEFAALTSVFGQKKRSRLAAVRQP
jgi:hypothetical protein